MPEDKGLSTEEISKRIGGNVFYELCRNLDMSEKEISTLKFLNLSKEDKYQLILKYERGKETPREIYSIINTRAKWSDFVMRQQWDFDSLKFSGNKIREETKETIINDWLTRKIAEGVDEQTAREQLVWMIDDLTAETLMENLFQI